MIKRLKKFLITLNFCKKKEVDVPSEIRETEKILRTIFSPINLRSKSKAIQANAFSPPYGIDEISVNRLTFTNVDFCRKLGKAISMPGKGRDYFGFGLLYNCEIIECNATVEYSPQKSNIYHADIKIGYAPKRGDTMPAEFKQKTKKLAEKARLFTDPNLYAEKWEGENVE